jgi:hypothetical protein
MNGNSFSPVTHASACMPQQRRMQPLTSPLVTSRMSQLRFTLHGRRTPDTAADTRSRVLFIGRSSTVTGPRTGIRGQSSSELGSPPFSKLNPLTLLVDNLITG